MCHHKVEANVKYNPGAMQFIAQHRRSAIEQCISALTHSCLCHDAFCRHVACTKMKRVVVHTKICHRKVKGNCPICKQLIALCCYHAKNCRVNQCAVPFCNTVKQKMREQNLMFDRLSRARGLKRQHEDEAESLAVDVNMAAGPSFGDEFPSVSGYARAEVKRVAVASSDSDDDETADDEVSADDERSADDESGPSREPAKPAERPLPADESERAPNPADQPLPDDESDISKSEIDKTE